MNNRLRLYQPLYSVVFMTVLWVGVYWSIRDPSFNFRAHPPPLTQHEPSSMHVVSRAWNGFQIRRALSAYGIGVPSLGLSAEAILLSALRASIPKVSQSLVPAVRDWTDRPTPALWKLPKSRLQPNITTNSPLYGHNLH
jgi:hypothetical protein